MAGSQSFEVDLEDIEHLAKADLPAMGQELRAVANTVRLNEGVGGSISSGDVQTMEAAYAHFCDMVGVRQLIGCARIDDTATALDKIVALYRRADGSA